MNCTLIAHTLFFPCFVFISFLFCCLSLFCVYVYIFFIFNAFLVQLIPTVILGMKREKKSCLVTVCIFYTMRLFNWFCLKPSNMHISVSDCIEWKKKKNNTHTKRDPLKSSLNFFLHRMLCHIFITHVDAFTAQKIEWSNRYRRANATEIAAKEVETKI